MTEIKIFRNGSGYIVKAELTGHTGYSEVGSDIVCASVSSAVYMALNGIESVLGISFGFETDDGYLMFVLPDKIDDNERNNINILLESMYLFLVNLQEQYPGNIRLTELEV